ncbi:MAG: DUF2442 domain-containing protein [Chitinophagales bacterium]|nr:DUF2442 domain-containing protein [Chitinophagales bacterium]
MRFPKVISVKALEKYKLFVSFDDGVSGMLDLQDLAQKGVFKYWDEDDNFKKVFIHPDLNYITWPGDLDIDTINSYCTIKGIDPEDFLHSEKQHASN